VIITGGLGSTDDDITNEIAASALNRPLCLDEEMYEQIKDYVALRGLKMSRAFEKMAWMPEDAKILCPKENVCGFSLVENRVRLYFLPGVPEQMRFLMDEVVIPEPAAPMHGSPHLEAQGPQTLWASTNRALQRS